MPLSKSGEIGVTAIVELLALISSDETLGVFAQAPPFFQIAIKKCHLSPPRSYHGAQVHASCITFAFSGSDPIEEP